jgi:hypothetical protein
MAVMLVASGHGLIAVIKPRIKAVTTGKELLLMMFCKNSSIQMMS